mmetsp:Transcript_32280/g.102959  ORF Transcript_32280/g.102959 Transcript_32280/m.102959 type:complete len:404 (-) Transcript_32280:787-1998(-)
MRTCLPSRYSPASSTALSTCSVVSRVMKPTPLNSCVSRSLSQRVATTVPAGLKKAEIFSSSMDHGRFPTNNSTQPSGLGFCGLYVRCGLPADDLPADSHPSFFSRGLEKLMRAGRPARSTPSRATALVADSTESKSTNALPMNCPSFSRNLTRVTVPQPSKALRTAASSIDQDRLPRKMASDGSPGSLAAPVAPALPAALRGAASSIFIGLPSRSLPLSAVAAEAAAADSNWRKPAPLNLPVSACVNQSMLVMAPQLAKTSLIWSSLMENGRLPMKQRSLPSAEAAAAGAAAGLAAGPFFAAGASAGSSAARFFSFFSFFSSFSPPSAATTVLASFFAFLAAFLAASSSTGATGSTGTSFSFFFSFFSSSSFLPFLSSLFGFSSFFSTTTASSFSSSSRPSSS